ncbi:sulfite exporter TauE/SafE family protein [Fredinandcohnia sp. QZ13]|uniref:sulfite exporter TauE/SafE family protein n=1 Tax=Fredinandcohnia sp. QZ13 TaxID=3073144 RepID=UPI00285317BF|nr:sulfite exporter TauE/SafE family protein [Fredinandcohnia sp. QZ13]MDR4886748.1 sulfite exporter TauE/SafE family protein [Fredinandcohnia sp. QZ13]
MKRLVLLAFIGLAAQLVDGSLGMAYGVTSTSLLLMFGIAPAVASASVHMAEVVTTAASGVSHIKFGNVDKQVVYKLIIPGSIGAFLGACFLSSIPGDIIKPYISIFLLILGVFVIYKFLFKFNSNRKSSTKKWTKKQFVPLGFIAGFFDATGGGGWGPIATPVLLTGHKMEPRKVIGSVDTSEFAIAVSSTLGFLLTLGWSNINLQWVLALMIGGIIAAPIAAWLVKIIPTNLLGTLVGGIIIITNIRTLLGALDISQVVSLYTYIILSAFWLIAVVNVIWKLKKSGYNKQVLD